jgi:hypothetical protein
MFVTTTVEGDIEFDIRFEGRAVPTSEPVTMTREGYLDLAEDEFVEGLSWIDIEEKYRRSPSPWDWLRRLLGKL